MDSVSDIHFYNDLRLIIDFIEKPINIGRLTADRVSPGYGSVPIRLALENRQ